MSHDSRGETPASGALRPSLHDAIRARRGVGVAWVPARAVGVASETAHVMGSRAFVASRRPGGAARGTGAPNGGGGGDSFDALAARTGPDGARSWADVTTQAVIHSMRATSGGFRRVNADLGTV